MLKSGKIHIVKFRGKILHKNSATKLKKIISWQNLTQKFCHEMQKINFVAE